MCTMRLSKQMLVATKNFEYLKTTPNDNKKIDKKKKRCKKQDITS